MTYFLLRRFMFSLISIIGATVFMFGLSRMAHDPRELFVPETGYGMTQEQWEALGDEMGFDEPVVVQYFLWLGRLLRGDLGESLGSQLPVRELIMSKLGATLQLALGGWLFAILVGVPLGVVSAVKRATLWDYIGRGFALFGQALPAFWTGIMAILVFAVVLHWLPSGTRGEGLSIKHYILPCIVLGWPAAAGITRLTRSAMLDVLDSEYVKLARAKGLSGKRVIWKHAFRNSLIPPLTSALLLMAGYLNGALVVETVFSWPGVGWLVLNQAVYNNDFPLLLGGVLMYIIIFLLFALLADILYAYIDPRIRY
jgi:peptide/nickel transport system permease protein